MCCCQPGTTALQHETPRSFSTQAWDERYPNVVLENGTRAWRRLRLACETAKRDLTAAEVANIYLPELTGANEVGAQSSSGPAGLLAAALGEPAPFTAARDR